MNKEMKCILKNQMTIMAVLRDVATDHNKDGYIRSLNDRRAETNLLLKDRKSTRLNSSHIPLSRMPSSA